MTNQDHKTSSCHFRPICKWHHEKVNEKCSFWKSGCENPWAWSQTPWLNIHLWCLKTVEPWSICPTTWFQFLYLQQEVNISNLLCIVCYVCQMPGRIFFKLGSHNKCKNYCYLKLSAAIFGIGPEHAINSWIYYQKPAMSTISPYTKKHYSLKINKQKKNPQEHPN